MDLWVDTNVSEEHTASFKAEDGSNIFQVTTQKRNIDIFTTMRISNLVKCL
jgi:hypothetical protein